MIEASEKRPTVDVSILCTAYNHERFIADALLSFINQETRYSIEVIVHDDASMDSTPEIIRQFQERYPMIVKPILQRENQTSKGISVSEICASHAHGRYIAICEGDDFWIDTRKLEKQINYLETHRDCTFCFTNGRQINAQTGRFENPCLPGTWHEEKHFIPGTQDLGVSEVVYIPCAPTASYVYPREVHERLLTEKREYPSNCFKGDYYCQLLATSYGYAHFIDEEMVAYRVANADSMTGKWRDDRTIWTRHAGRVLSMLESFDVKTRHQYSNEIQECALQYRFSIAFENLDSGVLREKTFREYAKTDPSISMLNYWVAVLAPSLYRAIRKMKNK